MASTSCEAACAWLGEVADLLPDTDRVCDMLWSRCHAEPDGILRWKIDAELRAVLSREWLASIAATLLAKNAAYGDSAANPLRVFSSSETDEGIRIRIDDKLSRMARGDGSGDEDARADLVGYVALLEGYERTRDR